MNETDEIKVGSVVELNSGGPWMTVLALTEDRVTCQWMTSFLVKTSEFPKACIRLKPKKS